VNAFPFRALLMALIISLGVARQGNNITRLDN
jgi:hypothetical protein